MIDSKMLANLKQKVAYKWKVQSYNSKDRLTATRATCVAYIDSRDVQEILDKSVGPENWQDDYKVINENLYCGIGIRIGDDWVWKWDCGTESDYEAEKGEASDAFKRAGVKWGVGRFLYDLEIKYVDVLGGKIVDGNKKPIYNLTKHFNGI